MASAYKTPEMLKKNTLDLHQNAVDKRVDFVQLLRARGVQSLIKTHIGSLNARVPCWLGGSQSWEHWENKLPQEAKLTELQKVSMMAGNADIFLASNTVLGCQNAMIQAYPIAVKIKEECDILLADAGYTVSLDTVGFKCSKKGEFKFNQTPTAYELFPAYVINMSLRKNTASLPTLKTRSRSKAPQEAPQQEYPFDGKLLVYLEVFHMPEVNMELFQNTYLLHDDTTNVNYLNPLGLITFSLMIGITRQEKGLDVDTQRRMAFFTTMISHTKDKAYLEIRDTYEKLFRKSPIYDEEFTYKMNIEILRARSPQADALFDAFDEWVIERLRPSINSYIVATNKRIMAETENRAFMFISGGDAMRRYKKSISATKDIDTKIYIDGGKKRKRGTAATTMERQVAKIVENEMSKLVYYLGTNKQRLFGMKELDTLQMPKPENGVMIKMQFYTNNYKNMQFRMRLTQRNEAFPVTLFSMDYRGYLSGSIDGVPFTYKHEIPVLDVVIEDNIYGKTRDEVVHNSSGRIPVASLDFLLNDIVKIYNTEHLALMRVWNNKKKKDLDRFHKLRDLYMKRMNASSGSQSSNGSASPNVLGHPVNLDAVDGMYNMFAEGANVEWYLKMFHDIKLKNKLKCKHKMPFDFEKIMDELHIRRRLRSISPPSSEEEDAITSLMNKIRRLNV